MAIHKEQNVLRWTHAGDILLLDGHGPRQAVLSKDGEFVTGTPAHLRQPLVHDPCS